LNQRFIMRKLIAPRRTGAHATSFRRSHPRPATCEPTVAPSDMRQADIAHTATSSHSCHCRCQSSRVCGNPSHPSTGACTTSKRASSSARHGPPRARRMHVVAAQFLTASRCGRPPRVGAQCSCAAVRRTFNRAASREPLPLRSTCWGPCSCGWVPRRQTSARGPSSCKRGRCNGRPPCASRARPRRR